MVVQPGSGAAANRLAPRLQSRQRETTSMGQTSWIGRSAVCGTPRQTPTSTWKVSNA